MEVKYFWQSSLHLKDHFFYNLPHWFCSFQATFEKLEGEMNEVNANSEALKRNFLELTELKHILRKTQTFFDEVYYCQP